MRRTHAAGPSTILLVVLALLASSAGFAVRSSGDARARLAAVFAPGASSVDRAHGLSSDADGATRTAFVRPASPAITRSHAPISGRGGDARGAVALAAPLPSLERAALRAPARIEARQDGVSSPGQPAPAARAPPIG
jgi:hypothetical protein